MVEVDGELVLADTALHWANELSGFDDVDVMAGIRWVTREREHVGYLPSLGEVVKSAAANRHNRLMQSRAIAHQPRRIGPASEMPESFRELMDSL